MTYIIIDAEGYYGNYAVVYSSHPTLDEARQKLGRRRDRRVVLDAHQKGDLIHRQFASRLSTGSN